MDVEYCLENEQGQKIAKDNGRCSYSTDMAKDLVMEDLPGSANDEEDENVADLSDLEDVEVQRQRLNAKLEKNKSSGRAANLVRKELRVQPAQYSGDSADMKQIVPFGSSQKKNKSSGRDANVVKQAQCLQAGHYGDDIANMKQIVPFGSSQNVVHDNKEIKEQALVSVPPDRNYVVEPSNSDSVDDISYDYLKTIRTAKGGIRRKHHRSWTLHEVVKLVDGVSHFGVGRWSDIKKLAFSSSGYRTSVDLKDKWRNLLRASYAQLQTNKQAVNRRNHASVPIPAHILVRVRELAATQPRAICTPSSNSSLSRSGRTVHKRHIINYMQQIE